MTYNPFSVTPMMRRIQVVKNRRLEKGTHLGEREEEQKKISLAKRLGVCHQPEGGHCQSQTMLGDDDARCSLSSSARISCPYLGKPVELKASVEEKEEKTRRLEMIVRPPPEIDV